MAYVEEIPQSASEMFNGHTVGKLKTLAKVAAGLLEDGRAPSKWPTRKDDLVRALTNVIVSEAALRKIYERLDKLEQAAIQEAVFSSDETLDWARFQAKYGDTPDANLVEYSYDDKKTDPLRLFLSDRYSMPDDLKKMFSLFVPRPKEVELETTGQLPSTVKLCDKQEALAQHLTEEAAVHDVSAVLRLADAGSIGASDRTGQVTEAGARAVRRILLHGDFYPEGTEAPDEYDVQMGTAGIRPFAWPIILQAGGLAKAVGNKLLLTKTGKAALDRAPQELLKTLWERWIEYDDFHELNRIDAVKGQKSSGRPLASAVECREALEETLATLTPGKWISTEAFFRFLIASGRQFDAVRDDWALYIGDRQYGSFGYNHVTWEHLNGRFARAFLLEFAAAMGLMDVALTPPWGSANDLSDLWGTDSMSCLSRYDGLRYLRLNPLGAWILGAAESYRPAVAEVAPLFRILPNLEVTVTAPTLSPADRLFLERICAKASERVWQLSGPKLLKAMEDGIQEDAPKKFLAARSAGALPQTVESFLDDAKKRASRLRDAGAARLVRCADAETAALIANNPKLRNLCLPAGADHVVVFGGKEDAFRRSVRELGYGVLAK